jgi:hypothetical protein
VFDVRERHTTSHVEQRVVEGHTETTADRGLITQPIVRAVGICQAITALDIGAFKVTFKTEDELTGLPVVASVNAANDAIGVVVLIEASGQARSGDELVIVVVTPSITDLSADVEPGPVVNCGNSHGRLGVGPSGQIRGGGADSTDDQGSSSDNELFHFFPQTSNASNECYRTYLRGSTNAVTCTPQSWSFQHRYTNRLPKDGRDSAPKMKKRARYERLGGSVGAGKLPSQRIAFPQR